MKLKEIVDCSLQNLRLFATTERVGNHLIVHDVHQSDKYYHNFIYLFTNQNYTKEQLFDYYKDSIQQKKDFIIFRIDEPEIRMEDFSDFGEIKVDENLYYAAKINKLKIQNKHNYVAKRITSDQQKLLEHIIYEGSKEYGISYAEGNARRRSEVLFANPDVYHGYFVYHQEDVVGYIFTFRCGKYAELDDFWIMEKYQKQGYGSTLLDFVIHDLAKAGIEEVFLVASKEDTPRYMYEKMNFKLIGESKMIRKMLVYNEGE